MESQYGADSVSAIGSQDVVRGIVIDLMAGLGLADPLPRWFIHMPVGRKPQFLTSRAFP